MNMLRKLLGTASSATVAALLGLALCLAWGRALRSAEAMPASSEIREFEVYVDEARAGKSKLTINDYDDGRSIATTAADIRVSILLYSYVYQFNGSEEWAGDTFRGVDSKAVDGFTRLSLKARVEEERTVLQTADGKTSTVPAHALTTNFWRLPPEKLLGKRIPVIDADTGKTLQLEFRHVGSKPLTLLGKSIICEQYKVSGDKEYDLWFDGSGRLVRQIGSEDGHKTELRLASFRQTRR